MGSDANTVLVYDSSGTSLGLFGLLEILAEFAEFVRQVLSSRDDDGEIIGGFLSDSRVTEAERFRETVAEWLPPPMEAQPSTAVSLRRCLKEAAGRVTEDEQRRLMNHYGKSVEHEGLFAPTFCEMVARLGAEYRDHCEQEFAASEREKFVSTLLRCNFELLSSEVSRELRWLGKRLLDQPSDIETSELPKSGVMDGDAVKAGFVLKKRMEDDPELAASWERVRARFLAYAEAMRSPEVITEIRAAEALMNAEIEAAGLTPPNSIEEWMELGRVVGISRSDIDNETLGTIFEEVRIYSTREKSRAKILAAEIAAQHSQASSAASALVQQAKAVYISYKCGDDTDTGRGREAFIDRLDDSLQTSGYYVRRDKRDIGYKDSIHEFMDELGRGHCIVVVLTDEYLHSRFCMYELVQIYLNHDFRKRIVPVVLRDVAGLDPMQRLKVANFWSERRNQHQQEFALNLGDSSHEGFADFHRVRQIAQNCDAALSHVFDMNYLNQAQLEANYFQLLKEAIDERMEEPSAQAGRP